MRSFLDSHPSAAAVNKKLRFETSHDPISVKLESANKYPTACLYLLPINLQNLSGHETTGKIVI